MRYLIIILVVLVPFLAKAEDLPLTWTEPANQSGTLARTCLYIAQCIQASVCTSENWRKIQCFASADGDGGDAKNFTVTIPIYEGDLPVTVRYTVTAVNTDGNETARGQVVGSHTFTAP